MTSVLLLRSPSTEGPDKYEDAFRAQGYRLVCVPVLETVLMNREDLGNMIRDGPDKAALRGVIVTSARACEAWKEAVLQLGSGSVSGAGESNSKLKWARGAECSM
jgi:uroporphyrinogen-III synthase